MRYFQFPNQAACYATREQLIDADYANRFYFGDIRIEADGKYILALQNDPFNAAAEAILDQQVQVMHWFKGTVEEARQIKINEIYQQFQSLIDGITSGYSEIERSTWDQQLAEAQAYLASENSADAPFLQSIANARNITLDEQAQIIIDRRQAFLDRAAQLMGQRAAIASQIAALEDVAEIMDFEYSS